jgi:hypothetical protein
MAIHRRKEMPISRGDAAILAVSTFPPRPNLPGGGIGSATHLGNSLIPGVIQNDA